MFWDFLRRFIKSWFFPNGRGYSLRGFWGEIKHFNKYGVQIGYSVKSFWGGRKRYDMNGNLISYTVRNFWGGYNTYDANGNLIRKSYRNLWGGYNTYNRVGKKVTESYQSFWGGMNHFDVEDYDSTETCSFDKRRHTSVPNQKVDYNSLFSQQIDKTIPFYESVSEFCGKQDANEAGVKILAFSYEGLKEFPAYAYELGDKVSVSPLIKNVPAFTFDKSEIAEARRKVMEGLDMSVVDNEFASFCASKMITEFDNLFPEYEYGNDGIARVQYELKCGLVITENSWLKLEEAFG